MFKTIKKHLVIPGIFFVVMIFAVIGFLAKVLNEEVAFLILVTVALSMLSIHFRSVWKRKEELPSKRKIRRIYFYLSTLTVTFCLILLILSFLDIHIIFQMPK